MKRNLSPANCLNYIQGPHYVTYMFNFLLIILMLSTSNSDCTVGKFGYLAGVRSID